MQTFTPSFGQLLASVCQGVGGYSGARVVDAADSGYWIQDAAGSNQLYIPGGRTALASVVREQAENLLELLTLVSDEEAIAKLVAGEEIVDIALRLVRLVRKRSRSPDIRALVEELVLQIEEAGVYSEDD